MKDRGTGTERGERGKKEGERVGERGEIGRAEVGETVRGERGGESGGEGR